jgi:phosphate transport system permease protein
MTETSETQARVARRLASRHGAEKRFKFIALVAAWIGLVFLGVLLFTVIESGHTAILQTKMLLKVTLQESDLQSNDGGDRAQAIAGANYNAVLKRTMRETFPDAKSRSDKRSMYRLVSVAAPYEIREAMLEHEDPVGKTLGIWVSASDDVDLIIKGTVPRTAPADQRHLSDKQMKWLEGHESAGGVEAKFNTTFFTSGDSREPELAGILGGAVGSLYAILVCLAISFPLGVMSAVYLECFAPKNRITEFIEVNINNLAAVPSIVFGLLGLAIFLNTFMLPRSAPLVGGMVLSLLTLPTIIIAGRAAIKSVPPSVREAALALGASPIQAVFHHVLPLAMPGILTGTIIGTAGALGETAPLLMIGMVAFIVDVPTSVTDPATVLPVQIFLWSDIPEKAFVERTSAAILVLLSFVCLLNLFAVYLRKRFETRW